MRRQSWRLRVASADAAFAARGRFRAEVEDLLPAFNRAFDEWTPAGEVLHIPRIELVLRVGSLDELARALAEALAREAHRPPGAKARPEAAARLAVLRRYLETGMLEWHAMQPDAASAIAGLQGSALAELRAAAAGAAATAAAPERFRYFFRLLQLLPAERWPEVAAHAPRPVAPPDSATGADDEETALAALAAARASLGAYRSLRLAAIVLSAAAREPAQEATVAEMLAAALGTDPAAPDALAAALAGIPPPAGRLLAARAALVLPAPAARAKPYLPPASPPRPDGPIARHDTPRPASLRPTRPAGPAPRVASDDAASAPRFDTIREGAAVEKAEPAPRFALMASNSGLVLLHPFLPQLFEACDLYREREWVCLPRAAALLHWLATGADEPYEFELAAAKILLGLEPDAQLQIGPGLIAERDREEGEALLRAAIAHWKVLRGTSVEGLRVSFLQRRGALREDDEGWRLQLEPESFDLLLKDLPWSISTVKLPWMTRPLFTDWPTP